MLASRSLKAVVDNTLEKKATPKVLSSSADLRLLYQVYQRQGLLAELIDILNNPDIGITSDVGKNDVEFVDVKINTLVELKRWKDLRLFCIAGLEALCKHYEAAAKITQDVPNELGWVVAWQPWRCAVTASQEDRSSGSPDDVLKLAHRYLEVDPHHRNAGNAVLLHHSLFSKAQLLSSCKTFFEAHSSRVSCFDDLKQVVEGLESEQRSDFYTFLTEMREQSLNGTDVRTKLRQITSKTNAMKLQYLLHFSDMETRDDTETATFIAQCLEIYGSGAEQEDRPSDDAGILAIAALMKFGSVKSQVYNLQAACLIHLLRDNSQYNFQATLLQLLNARILGLGSIAIAAFRDLKTQEVQLDTLGHLLYTRIATLHPWEVSLREVKALDDRFKNPQASITHSLQYPRRATNATLDTLTKDLDNVYFDKFYEFLGFNERVGTSFSIMQSRLELQRMRRLTDHTNIVGEIFKSYSFKSSDNRDFGALVDFEPSNAQRSFRDIATNGYKPGVSTSLDYSLGFF
jgi:N-terminal acetyltransferase B complex non-catalytic subunit